MPSSTIRLPPKKVLAAILDGRGASVDLISSTLSTVAVKRVVALPTL
jgi:hypothetical protein